MVFCAITSVMGIRHAIKKIQKCFRMEIRQTPYGIWYFLLYFTVRFTIQIRLQTLLENTITGIINKIWKFLPLLCNIRAKYIVDYFQSIKCCLLNLKSFLSPCSTFPYNILFPPWTHCTFMALCNNGLKNQLIFKVRKVLFVPPFSSFL